MKREPKPRRPPPRAASGATSHVLRIDLQEVRPPIWRRVRVPSAITLAELHDVVQIAMGWTDSHLHRFVVGGERYTIDPVERELDALDSSKVTLAEVAPRPKAVLGYEYDFGDDWKHRVLVEDVVPSGDEPGPTCVAGKRACPPEDCGGPWGYAELLVILADERHPDHEERLEWAGGPIDPEAFDLDGVDAELRRSRRRRAATRQDR